MKKIIVVFIAISMLLASLAGSFTSIPSARAWIRVKYSNSTSTKAPTGTITGTWIINVQTVPASSQAFNFTSNINSVLTSFTLIANTKDKKVIHNVILFDSSNKIKVQFVQPEPLIVEGYAVPIISSVPAAGYYFPEQGDTIVQTFIYKKISTVTFDANGGTPTPAPITGIFYGAKITLPKALTKVGYTFASWNTKADGTGEPFTATTPVIADITVYATYKFIAIPINIFVYYQPLFLGYPNGTFKPERKVFQAEIAGALIQGPGLSFPIEGKVVSFKVIYFKGIIFTAPFLFVLKAKNSLFSRPRQGLIGEQGQIATPPLAAPSLEVKKCYLPTLLWNKTIIALRGSK